LVASFLYRVFVKPNVRVMPAAGLTGALEGELFALRERLGSDAFPKGALEYLNDWAAPEKGWLRKFYAQGSDEPQFDLTPPAEKAIAWLGALTERNFIGTESRLLTLFELLKQMSEGSEADPAKRLAELHKRREEIDAEIARATRGDVGRPGVARESPNHGYPAGHRIQSPDVARVPSSGECHKYPGVSHRRGIADGTAALHPSIETVDCSNRPEVGG